MKSDQQKFVVGITVQKRLGTARQQQGLECTDSRSVSTVSVPDKESYEDFVDSLFSVFEK